MIKWSKISKKKFHNIELIPPWLVKKLHIEVLTNFKLRKSVQKQSDVKRSRIGKITSDKFLHPPELSPNQFLFEKQQSPCFLDVFIPSHNVSYDLIYEIMAWYSSCDISWNVSCKSFTIKMCFKVCIIKYIMTFLL